MKYLLLIHPGGHPTPETEEWQSIPADERAAIFDAYNEINATPGVTPGNRLHPPDTATTVRVQGDEVLVTDGPFVATKEALGGFLVFEADDLEAAIELAARVPAASRGGAVEVRPLVGA